MKSADTAIIVLGPSALPVAKQIRQAVGGRIVGPKGLDGCDRHYDTVSEEVRDWFQSGFPVIGIFASAILIRLLGPSLRDKRAEPPVLAVAEDGSSVVPLLGGHHGANDLAEKIAACVGGHAAITTASDVRFGESFDNPAPGLVLANPEHMKSATAARLRGEHVTLETTLHNKSGNPAHLIYHPTNLAVGIGCERGTDPLEVRKLLDDVLRENDISPMCINCYASIDLKEDEPAITQFELVRFFTADELKAQSPRIATPSEIVESEVGTPSVAEAAALAIIGDNAELIVTKRKSKRATVAIAQAKAPTFLPQGRWRGRLQIVGIGPGDKGSLSPNADLALLTSTEWVGYSLYLDLVEDRRLESRRHDFPLGDEEARCRKAIGLAKEGKDVALVCSGDAGIYAMAALVYELIDREPCRIAVEVYPGISAFQAASAKAGAMIGHDFCCISLSDLLTPWETIEQRIKAAAEGDFVISFYNPRSLKRTDQIVKAFEILKPRRRADTPVVLASNLGRADEQTRIIRFGDFNAEDVDMLTLVMVGSSQSRSFIRGDGRTYAYTPRGYAKKMEPQ